MCRLCSERSKDGGESEIIGNETLLGQVASFMENLHLSYKEVFEEIPYQNLILMQKDKLHVAYGSVVTESSSEELFGDKIKG